MELESGTPTDAGLENDGAHGIGLEDEGQAQKVGGGGGAGAGAIFWHGGSVYDARLNAVSAQPGPCENPVQCFIKRDKTTSTYQLFLGLPSTSMENGKFLLAARKFCRATSIDYIISMNPKDMSRGSTTYVGELRSNFLGTKFTIYDSQPLHNGVLSSCVHSRSSRSYNVAHIAYELNALLMRRPRCMQCTLHTIPASAMELSGSAPIPTKFTASTLVSSLLSKDKPLVLKNIAPRWHKQLHYWFLDFRGRVTMASPQNFQLVASTEAPPLTMQSDHDKILLQFGKIGNDMFTMDYRYPLSAFQAFAICLSSFNSKLLCE